MRLNTFEKALMNNPIRAALQRHFEARILKKLGGTMQGGLALEIGCGRGIGTCIIFEEFRAEHVHAFDIDPHMVQLARHTSCCRSRKSTLWVGDTLNIAVSSNTYDAVFDFGAIHHVVQWRDTIRDGVPCAQTRGAFLCGRNSRKIHRSPAVSASPRPPSAGPVYPGSICRSTQTKRFHRNRLRRIR